MVLGVLYKQDRRLDLTPRSRDPRSYKIPAGLTSWQSLAQKHGAGDRLSAIARSAGIDTETEVAVNQPHCPYLLAHLTSITAHTLNMDSYGPRDLVGYGPDTPE
jgi:hypothetical protein